jgi:N-acetylmuramic acid 6-phosphate etherase
MMLQTEQRNAGSAQLDQLDTSELVAVFLNDQVQAIQAARDAQAQISKAVALAQPRIEQGGRLIYVGAGTSGRLGLLDSVELNPTFSWPSDRSLCLLAGGTGALKEAAEGAEDDAQAAASDLLALKPTALDVVVAIAASGRTPYALAALETAAGIGCLRIAIVNNLDSPMQRAADVCIELNTGPEVISGSTRLKAGTSQKIALNSFSSALMVRLNKVHDNWMVDLRITNKKLKARALTIISQVALVDEPTADEALQQSGLNIKVAIVALLCKLSPERAKEQLDAHRGSIRGVLSQQPTSSK